MNGFAAHRQTAGAKGYDDLDERLTGRCRERRKVGNNTYAERRGDRIAIRLHSTDVVTFLPDGSIMLNTGGWYSVTTKDRMNSYLPGGVWDADWCELGNGPDCALRGETVDGKFHWHGRHEPASLRGRVWSNRGRWMVTWGDETYAYQDGIVLHPDGTVTGAMNLLEVQAADKRIKKINAKIDKFLKRITPERIIERWENPQGDCWGCMMETEAGEHPLGHSCVAEHVDEDYFHAHLVMRAFKSVGYGKTQVEFWMPYIYQTAKRGQVEPRLIEVLRRFLRKQMIDGVATR